MPDITMCRGDGCPLKNGCYRHIAKPDKLQSYFLGSPRKSGESCAYYIEAVSVSQVLRPAAKEKDE